MTRAEIQARYRAKHRDQIRAYYLGDREGANRRQARYVAKDREAYLTKCQEFYRANLPRAMWINARVRAKRAGVPCTIKPEDIVIPTHCPVLGIPLAVSHHKPTSGSPSLDRIIPSKGYVPGNIIVVSFRANTIKRDASPEELRAVADFYLALCATTKLKPEGQS